MRGFLWLMLYWLVGEFIVRALHFPLPGQIVGMVLMLLSLLSGIIKIEYVHGASSILLKHMMLLFVPVVVGVMVYYPEMVKDWLSIITTIGFGTIGVLAATGVSVTLSGEKKGGSVEH